MQSRFDSSAPVQLEPEGVQLLEAASNHDAHRHEHPPANDEQPEVRLRHRQDRGGVVGVMRGRWMAVEYRCCGAVQRQHAPAGGQACKLLLTATRVLMGVLSVSVSDRAPVARSSVPEP